MSASASRIRRSPLWQLCTLRLRTYVRDPETLIFGFLFPLLLSGLLAVAFRNQPPPRIEIAVAGSQKAEVAALTERLASSEDLTVTRASLDEAKELLRRGKVALVAIPGEPLELLSDPTQPDARTGRLLLQAAIERAPGAQGPTYRQTHVTAPGSRYIDFLIPGLLGFGLLTGSGSIVSNAIGAMRDRKLLRGLRITPMPRLQFLLSFVIARCLFSVLEILFFALYARALFDVRIAGNLASFFVVGLAGAFTFGGLYLLVAARARTMEAIGGWTNFIVLPSLALSGVFFPTSHLPSWAAPLIHAMPLTALNDALRAIMVEGASLTSLAGELLVLAAWCVVSFVGALRYFRWD